MSAAEYGARERNIAADMIREITQASPGTARSLSREVAAQIVIAQCNLAIAASIAELADVLRSTR
jgi:hypothetical protein